MKKVIQRVVSVIMLLAVCVGVISGYAEVANAAELSRSTETTRYIVLLLDVEGGFPMLSGGKEIYKVETPLNEVKSAAKRFIEQVQVAGGNNYVAIVTYGAKTNLFMDFTKDLNSASMKIDWITTQTGFADVNEALLFVKDMFENNRNAQMSDSKNIVHFTQGVNGVGEVYSTEGRYTSEDCGWYNIATNISFYEYSNATYNTFETMKDDYNIYSVGLFEQFDKVPEEGKEVLNFAKKFAEDIQDSGFQEVEDINDLIFAFDDIAEEITITPATFYFNGMYGDDDTEAICYYSDSYFMKDSNIYNSHLATASICLELTTWGTEDKTAMWTTDSNHKNPKFKNSRSLLVDELGFKEFEVNSFWGAKPTADSIGAVVANKRLSDGSTLIALAIRGGSYGQEWASNFTIGLSGQHSGFAEAKDNVISFLYDYIEAKQIKGDVKLWIVGYSRAGAVANLTAGELGYATDLPEGINLERKNIFAYTFEAPQGALKDDAVHDDYSYIHNTIGINDIVPLVAPEDWGFTRYGQKNILPNQKLIGDSFSQYKYGMERYLKQMEVTENNQTFNVKQKVTFTTLDIDTRTIFSFGNPAAGFVERELFTADAIELVVEALANDLIGSRENYYYQYQAIIRDIMCLTNNGEVSDLFNDEYDWSEFMSTLAEKLTVEKILKIASPLYAINFDTQVEREKKVHDNLVGFIQEVMEESDLAFSILAVSKLPDTLASLLENIFIFALRETSYRDFKGVDSIVAMINLIDEDVFFQPHYPEYVLAWMMYQDSYYGITDPINVGRSYRVIHINCPVDVNVYSEDSGKLVASIINNEPQQIEDSYIEASYNKDGEKLIVLPADTNYRVEIIATGDGVFNYTIEEYSYDVQGNARIVNYYDIPITMGDVLTAKLPKLCDEELYGENLSGSSIIYSLYDSDETEIVPDNEVRGEAALVDFDIDVICGNEYGYVLGGGSYSTGSFAQVEAYPMLGGEFIGWYNGDELVSTEECYRFPVKYNMELVAMFSEIELYEVTFVQEEGGVITNIPVTVPEGVSIKLEAEALEGYEFEGWTSNGSGVFGDVTSIDTTYIVASENTQITAWFKKIGEVEETIDEIHNQIQPEIIDTPEYSEASNVVDFSTGEDKKVLFWYLALFFVTTIIIGIKRRRDYV